MIQNRNVIDKVVRFNVSLMLAGSVIAVVMAGCSAAPSAPDDSQLRERAILCVSRAMRYPENPAVRAQGMEAAAEVLGSEARLHIREGLKDEEPGVRFAACVALGRIADAAALSVVKPLAADPDPSVRLGAYFALERMGDASYRRAWVDTLRNHNDPMVRRNAVMVMGQLKDPRIKSFLLSAANKDVDEGVRLQATEGLALLGDEDAIGRFRRDAFGGVGYRQPFATLILGQVTDNQAVAALRSRLRNAPYLETRLAAARGLGMHGYDDGFDLAVSSLSWNEPRTDLADDPPANQIMRVRSMAALALGDIGDQRAMGRLTQLMENPDDPRVQLAAARAILMILNRGLIS